MIIHTRILLLSLAVLLPAEVAIRFVSYEAAYFQMLTLGSARLLETGLLFLIVSTWGKGMSSIGLGRGKIVTGLKKGLIWSAVFGICVFLGFAFLYAAHINPLRLINIRPPVDAQGLVLFFVVGGLVASVAEEVFFRGILYGFLRRWGVLVAIFSTSVIFVLAHSTGAGVPLTRIVGGILFAVAYEVEGNLMVPITIHALGNMAIFAFSLVS